MNKVILQRRNKLRRMAIISLLSAISIILSITPLGFVPLGPVNATIMHIPVILGAILEGPIVGLTVGFVFGVCSLLKNLIAPTVISFVFINPIVSILPRIIMGVLSYYIFFSLMKVTKKHNLSGFITGVIGSLINTFGVLMLIYVLYADKYLKAMNVSSNASKWLFGIVLTNGLPEAIIAAVIVSAVVAVFKRRKEG